MLCIPVFTVQRLKPLKFELIISRKFDKKSPFYIPAFFVQQLLSLQVMSSVIIGYHNTNKSM